MTVPLFLLTPATLEPPGAAAAAGPGTALTLTGAEARHAVAVRRLRAGERVDLADGAGLRLRCTVTEAGGGTGAGGGKHRLGVRVLERVEEPAPSLRLALVQALAKGGRDEQAIETATEVGVDVVVPWQASRSVSIWSSAKRVRGRERWEATAREAAKQARRARVPRVEEPCSTRQIVAWVRDAVGDGGAVLVLHEEATAPLASVALPTSHRAGDGREAPVLAVVVGPEGGISGEEVAELEAAGATTARLGPHVMRTASAGPVALAVLAERAGLWG